MASCQMKGRKDLTSRYGREILKRASLLNLILGLRANSGYGIGWIGQLADRNRFESRKTGMGILVKRDF